MSEDNQKKLMNSCAGEIENFYRQALRCASFVSPPMDELLFSGNWYSSFDVYIRIDEGLHGSVLRLARKAVKSLGAESLGVEDFIAIAYKETIPHLSVELKEGGESRWRNFAKDFLARALEGYDVIFPCHSFEFTEPDLQLRSKYVCVMPAKSFVEGSKGQKYLLRIKLASEDGSWSRENFFSDGDLFIGGIIWWIKTDCPKDILPQVARWKAEVFISCLRLAMRPANNCTRARIGETELPPIGVINEDNRKIMFNERQFSFGGYKLMPLYRLDREFIDLFERSSFQETVDLVLKPPKKSLAERVANGLGWLARSRQSSDLSERLLHGFTALEALLSQQDHFSPVLDAMARMASVILSSDVSKRERIYSDLKSLYSIRSNLVHRGVRNVSKIDANNIQYISESCFQIVLQHIDLRQKHDDFISKLKISTHGSPWP